MPEGQTFGDNIKVAVARRRTSVKIADTTGIKALTLAPGTSIDAVTLT